MLGISHFAHLASGAVLRIADGVHVDDHAAEVSKKTAALFVGLQHEKAGVLRMVTVLTTVQRKGASNISIADVEEDDGVEE